jgi:hypothetical protein
MMQGGRRKRARGFDFATVAVRGDNSRPDPWPRLTHAKPSQEGAGSAECDSSGLVAGHMVS